MLVACRPMSVSSRAANCTSSPDKLVSKKTGNHSTSAADCTYSSSDDIDRTLRKKPNLALIPLTAFLKRGNQAVDDDGECAHSKRICSRHRLVRLRPRSIVFLISFARPLRRCDDILRNSSTASLCTQRWHTSIVASAQTRSATGRWRMLCSNLGRLTADWHCTVEIAGAPDSTEQLARQFPVGPWLQRGHAPLVDIPLSEFDRQQCRR